MQTELKAKWPHDYSSIETKLYTNNYYKLEKRKKKKTHLDRKSVV